MFRVLLLLVLWVLQTALVLLLIDAQWVERQVKAEQETAAADLGAVLYGELHGNAERIYRRWFVDSGAVDASYADLLPDGRTPKDATKDMAPWFFTWLEHRLDALWWMLYQAVHRLQLMNAWCFYIAALLAVAVVDGVVRWQIKRATHTPPSADRYLVGCRALLLLFIAPLVYFSLPLQIHPSVVPLWGCLLAFSLTLFIANLQQRV